VIALILANVVVDEDILAKQSPLYTEEAIAERLEPVGKVRLSGEPAPTATAEPAVAEAPAAPKSGEEVVAAACAACHQTGVLGAPKIGDTAAWQERYAQGMEVLIDHSANGYKGMPPQGGQYSNAELEAAIEVMLADSGIDVAPAEQTGTSATPSQGPGAGKSAEPGTGEPGPGKGEAEGMPAPEADEPAAQTSAVDPADGQQIYQTFCISCHLAGVAGAPKLGDRGAWASRLDEGPEPLYTSATQGRGAMPPKGGCMDCSEADIEAAVDYMIAQSQ
jgi:cytochrome c5